MSEDAAPAPPPDGMLLLPYGADVPAWLFRVSGDGKAQIDQSLLVYRGAGAIVVSVLGDGPAVRVSGKAIVTPAPGVRLYGRNPLSNRWRDVTGAWLQDRRLWAALFAGVLLTRFLFADDRCGPMPPDPGRMPERSDSQELGEYLISDHLQLWIRVDEARNRWFVCRDGGDWPPG